MARKKNKSRVSTNKSPRQGPRPQWHDLSPIIERGDYEELEVRAKAVLLAAGLQPTTEPHHVFGDKYFQASNGGDQATYYSKLRAFLKFHIMYSDYDEGIAIFYPYTPHHTMVGCDKAAAHFLLMQFADKGEEVVDHKKQTIFVTVNGKKQPLLGTGAWHTPASNLDGFTSALSGLHFGHGWASGADYIRACTQCASNHKQEIFHCSTHPPGQFQPRTSGNVIQSAYYKSTKTFIFANSDHSVKRCGQLRPSEVRKIGEHCLSSGSPFKVEIFVCLLFAIDLFLRKEEFRGVDFDSFIQNMMIMSGEFVIEGLVVKLKKKRTGSTEEKAALKRGIKVDERYATIWGDKEHSDLDLMRHLMGYIYMIGWKGGFLFPSAAEMENPPSDGIYKTCISAEELRAEVTEIITLVLCRKDKLALHFTRSTAYLFAIFRSIGPPNMISIAQAAGHSTANRGGNNTIAGYCHDAENLKHAISITKNGMINERLGPWITPYSEGGANAISVASDSAKYHKPLSEVARGFIEEVVKVNPFDPNSKNPIDLFKLVRQWSRPSSNAKESLQACTKFLNGDNQSAILFHAEELAQQYSESATIQERNRNELVMNAKFHSIVTKLQTKGHSLEEIKEILGDAYPTHLDNVPAELAGGSEGNKRDYHTVSVSMPTAMVTPICKKPRVDSRTKQSPNQRDKKTIEGRENFDKMNQEEKVKFMDDNYDPKFGDYVNSDRQWLIRIKPLVICYRGCCNRDEPEFKKKFAGANGKWSIVKARKKALTCSICNPSDPTAALGEQETPVENFA